MTGMDMATIQPVSVERASGRPRQSPAGDDIRAVPTADENETTAYWKQLPEGRSTRADARMFGMTLVDASRDRTDFEPTHGDAGHAR